MKTDPRTEAHSRLQALLARETGAPVSPVVQAELAAIVDAALGGPDTANLPVESREVTILVADLRGFIALTSSQPAGTIVTMLNLCLERMSAVIYRYQGVIDKFTGDSMTVLFGAPVQRPDDVMRAMACAVEMQLAMRLLNDQYQRGRMPELFMGIGLNTGTVMAGRFGSEAFSQYTVIGNQVSLASRIESFSQRGQVQRVIGIERPAQARHGQIEARGDQEQRHRRQGPQVAIDEPQRGQGQQRDHRGCPGGALAVRPNSQAEDHGWPPVFDRAATDQEHQAGGNEIAGTAPLDQVQRGRDDQEREQHVERPPPSEQATQGDEWHRGDRTEQRQALHGAGIGSALERARSGQVVRQDKNEDGQAKAAGIEQPINRAVEQILVDVIAGHEQQGKPLQRLDRAIGQYQARQRWRRFSA